MFLSKVIHIKILYETLHPERGRGHQTDGAGQDRGETQGRRRRATITRVSTPRVLSNQSNGCKESSGDVKNHTLLNTNPAGYNDSLQAIFISDHFRRMFCYFVWKNIPQTVVQMNPENIYCFLL